MYVCIIYIYSFGLQILQSGQICWITLAWVKVFHFETEFCFEKKKLL